MPQDASEIQIKVIWGSRSLDRLRDSYRTFLALTRDFEERYAAFPTAVSTAKQTDRYTCPATLGVTIFPSGSTTTKNGFDGLGVADCSALSPLMEKASLAIPDRIKLPNEIRCRIIEIATTIAAMIRDNRIKTILYKFVRLTVQVGCRIDCRLTRLPIFVSLDMRRTGSDDQDGLL
jgi:hypothetical protein